MKVLFVCTGNTCRSPMAEGIARKMAEERGKEMFCQSAGIATVAEMPASGNAVKVCAEIGVDLSGHRSRPMSSVDIGAFDVFFVMTATHGYVLKRAGVPEYKIYVPKREITDPYGGGPEIYRQCRDEIEAALQEFFTLLEEHPIDNRS